MYAPNDSLITHRPQFVNNIMFLKKLLQKFVAHIFTLLLAPFASKLVYYSRRSESFVILRNRDIFSRKRRFIDFEAFFKGSLCLEQLLKISVKAGKFLHVQRVQKYLLLWIKLPVFTLHTYSRLHGYLFLSQVHPGHVCLFQSARLFGTLE